MRSAALLLSLCGASGLFAQNWTLINPAYKYNYSLGGTDTITNQIFATQVDTLGPDSFRYELNRIGVQCDTCLASLGSDCDGCFIRSGVAQFLGGDLVVSVSGTSLFNTDRVLYINHNATTGSQWVFDTLLAVVATVDSVRADTIFGAPDSVKYIGLSSGGGIQLAKSFGLVRFEHSTSPGPMVLIGNQELALGRTIPDLGQMMVFDVGDIVEYLTEDRSASHPDVLTDRTHSKRTITQRTVYPDSIVFQASELQHYMHIYQNLMTGFSSGGGTSSYNTIEWTVPSTDIPGSRLLTSYPGELVMVDQGSVIDSVLCIAEHGLDSLGNYVVRAKRLTGALTEFSLLITAHQVAPGLFGSYDLIQPENGCWGFEGPGLMELTAHHGMGSRRIFRLVGAVIAGDTIGELDTDAHLLDGVAEHQDGQVVVSPNPADDLIQVTGLDGADRSFVIHGGTGRAVLSGRVQGATFDLQVGALKPGSYVLSMTANGATSRGRFMIVR